MREKILWHLWPLPLWNTANEMDDELPVFKDFPWNPSFSSSLWGFCRWLVVQQCARIPFPVSLGGGATGWFLGGREVVATPRLAHQPRCRHEEIRWACRSSASPGPSSASRTPESGVLAHLEVPFHQWGGPGFCRHHQDQRNETGFSIMFVMSSSFLLALTLFLSPSPARAQRTQSPARHVKTMASQRLSRSSPLRSNLYNRSIYLNIYIVYIMYILIYNDVPYIIYNMIYYYI